MAANALNVQTEVVSAILTRLKVVVPNERVDTDAEKRLQKFARTVKINGYRPGKVPLSKVRAEYGMAVKQEAINDVMRDTLFESLDANKAIRPVGMPTIETVDMKEDGLHYTATVETYPAITLNDYKDVEITLKTAEITDADVTDMIEQLRSQRLSWEEKSTKTELKDQVTIDFSGSIDGEKFEGGTATDSVLVLGSGRMIPGFEDGIVGMKVGETKTIEVTFPEDYQAENLKGKVAQFEISVKKVEAPKLPELDDAFLSQFGVKEGEGVEKFKADVTKNMQRELKVNLNNLNKGAAFDALLSAHEFEVPATMIKEEIGRQRERLIAQFSQQFGGKMPKFDESMLPDDLFAEKAERSVKLGVLLAKVLEDNNLTPDQAKVSDYIAEMADAYEDKAEVIEHFTSDKQQRGQIEAVVLENQIADLIVANAKAKTEVSNYTDVRAAHAALKDS